MPNEFKKESGESFEKLGWIEPQSLNLEKLENKEVFIRNAGLDDYQGLAKVIQDTWNYRTREWNSPKRDVNQEASRMNFLEESISDPERLTVLLVTVNNEVAGYVDFRKNDLSKYPDADPNVVRIDTLFVLEKYHGTGIGYSLLKYTEDIAQDVFHAQEIHLRTHSCNKDAIRLYSRNGYEESKTEEREEVKDFFVKGKQVEMIPLVKHLPEK